MQRVHEYDPDAPPRLREVCEQLAATNGALMHARRSRDTEEEIIKELLKYYSDIINAEPFPRRPTRVHVQTGTVPDILNACHKLLMHHYDAKNSSETAHVEARARKATLKHTKQVLSHASQRVTIHDLPHDVLDIILDRVPQSARGTCRLFRRIKPINYIRVIDTNIAQLQQIIPQQPKSHRICHVTITITNRNAYTPVSLLHCIGTIRPLHITDTFNMQYPKVFTNGTPIIVQPVSLQPIGICSFNHVDLSRMQRFAFSLYQHLECLARDPHPQLRWLHGVGMHYMIPANDGHGRMLRADQSVIMDAQTFTLCLQYGMYFTHPPIVLGSLDYGHDLLMRYLEHRSAYVDVPFTIRRRKLSNLRDVIVETIPPGDYDDVRAYFNSRLNRDVK